MSGSSLWQRARCVTFRTSDKRNDFQFFSHKLRHPDTSRLTSESLLTCATYKGSSSDTSTWRWELWRNNTKIFKLSHMPCAQRIYSRNTYLGSQGSHACNLQQHAGSDLLSSNAGFDVGLVSSWRCFIISPHPSACFIGFHDFEHIFIFMVFIFHQLDKFQL